MNYLMCRHSLLERTGYNTIKDKYMEAEIIAFFALFGAIIWLYAKVTGVKKELDDVKKKDEINNSSVSELQRGAISTKYEIEGIKTSLAQTNEAVQQSVIAVQRISDLFEQRLKEQKEDRAQFLEDIKQRIASGIQPLNVKIEYIGEYLKEIRHEGKK